MKKLILTAFFYVLISGVANAYDKTLPTQHFEHNPFAGKTFLVKTKLNNNEGYTQTWTFSKEGQKMDIDILDGVHKGLKDNPDLIIFKITDKIWFINWQCFTESAAKGNTISYVVDFNNHNIAGFFTMNPKAGIENRPNTNATGTFKEVNHKK